MIVVDIVLACCVAILFAVFVKQCLRIERCEDYMGMSEAEIQELRRRCDAYKELIEALSKSVRELNGVVEAAVKSKEPAPDDKPDMSALIGGWSVDDVRTEIDASHISTGTIDGKSLMNCELPNISEPVRENIFELLGVKVPEDEPKLTAYSMDRVVGRTVSGDVVWTDKKGHVHYGAYGD